jgi:putative oxygen-independent coproporphyrinogen III oxidase
MTKKGQIGIYLHWPFCLAKCPYCDFNSHVRERVDQDQWRAAFLKSLEHYRSHLEGKQVVSVFFGGGTPSLMPPDTVAAIVEKIHALAEVANDVEITLEANPTSVEMEKFESFRLAGVNRVSLGVQALNDNDLKFLGRQHNSSEAKRALDIAKKNFSRVSFDLIYARPEQSLAAWEKELDEAIALADGHLSLYQLTIERGTPFFLEHSRGAFMMPTDGLAADFYTMTQDVLSAHGLPAYEVSNHAREGQESRHNMIYWEYGDYIGIGPGAHGRLTVNGEKFATRDHRAPEIWLERAGQQGSAAHPFEPLSRKDRFLEALMMGLRLRDGVSLSRLEEEAGQPWRKMIDMAQFAALEKEKMIGADDTRMKLTGEGMLQLNAILQRLLRGA